MDVYFFNSTCTITKKKGTYDRCHDVDLANGILEILLRNLRDDILCVLLLADQWFLAIVGQPGVILWDRNNSKHSNIKG